jgi:hypothetical protein
MLYRVANASPRLIPYDGHTMTQHNLAFITGHARGSEPLDAALLAQVERFAAAGRKNIVVVMDTFPNLEEATIAALQGLLRRASELEARVTCVALEERVANALRSIACAESLKIISRVDELPGAA